MLSPRSLRGAGVGSRTETRSGPYLDWTADRWHRSGRYRTRQRSPRHLRGARRRIRPDFRGPEPEGARDHEESLLLLGRLPLRQRPGEGREGLYGRAHEDRRRERRYQRLHAEAPSEVEREVSPAAGAAEDPKRQLLAGVRILDEVMRRHGFEFGFENEGRGSGGRFANGSYYRDDRRLELHFRGSLG